MIDATLLTTAKSDLTTAYNDAAGRTPIPSGDELNPGGGNIGGLTLAPGLYKFTSAALISGADLTLEGGPEDVWIFQIGTGLELASGVKVILAGGARAENIFWQVGSSAVLGTFSVFKGTILADQSITMGTSSTLEGRALAFEANVVFDGSGAAAPVVLADEPEIAVEEPIGVDVPDGGSRDFGNVLVGEEKSLTFTIKNTGTADLTGLGITIDGVDAALFSVTSNPTSPVSGPNGSTTFTVRFFPFESGLKTAALHIANNDDTENPFDITLTGTATTPVAVTVLSPIELNPQTGLFEQTIRLSNISPTAVAAARVLIEGLPADVEVYNAAGEIGGVPFVQYNFSLAAFESVDLVIEYYRESRESIAQPTFSPESTDLITVSPTSSVLVVDRVLMLEDGRFLIEFSATPGSTYGVQYSSDMTTWTTVVPTITAPSNQVQWYDDGPPKTESMPADVASRFYRIFELP